MNATKSISSNVILLSLCGSMVFASSHVFSNENSKTGYYISGKVFSAETELENMDTSLRPGIGQFVEGEDTDKYTSGSFALGYQFKDNWRAEIEYTLQNESSFTSGSSRFPSINTHIVESKRLMVNLYKDINLSNNFSLFGTVGLGVTNISSSGSQTRPAGQPDQFNSSEQNNLTYSIGAGISYTPVDSFSLDLGYRYIDMGKIESGFNQFGNGRGPLGDNGRPIGLQDEQLRGDLVSSEVFLGARFKF